MLAQEGEALEDHQDAISDTIPIEDVLDHQTEQNEDQIVDELVQEDALSQIVEI